MTQPLLKFTHNTQSFTTSIILKDQQSMIFKVQSKINNKYYYANCISIWSIPDPIQCIIKSGLIDGLYDFYIALLSVKNSINFNEDLSILEVDMIFCHKKSTMEIPVEKDFQVLGQEIVDSYQPDNIGQIPEEFNEAENQIKKNNGQIYYAKFTEEQAMYEGQMLNGLKHGKGKSFFKNGDIYTGDYHEGYRHGYGELLYEDGEKYEGNFISDNMYGKGKYFMKNGTICESFYKLNLADGPGIETSPQGDITYGTYIDGVLQENFFNFYPNGDIAEQTVNGFVKYYYSKGQIFEGYFKDGLKDGFGTMYLADNVKEEGCYLKDQKHGEFSMIYTDGVIEKKFWFNGVICSEEEFKQQSMSESASPAPPVIQELAEEDEDFKPSQNPCPQNI